MSELELYDFQKEGSAEILRRRRCILADDQGLGKTIEAIDAVSRDGAFPCLCVVPATVKLNWEEEWAKWTPAAWVTVLNGMRAKKIEDGTDVVIVNYRILNAWQKYLSTIGFKSVVFDESHRLKSPDTQQSRAAFDFSESIDDDGIILLMSGTPMMNGPIEIAHQLDIIRKLGEFGGLEEFEKRYAPGFTITVREKPWPIKIKKNGAKNLEELNARLKSCCMIRREKKDVLKSLPPKRHGVVYLSPSKSCMEEYRAIEKEMNADENKGSTMKYLAKLRGVLGVAKVKDTLGWLEDHPEPIVIWVHHRAVGEALVSKLKCPAIRGGMTSEEKQAAIKEFQSGKATRIVCSIMAAGIGITLTAASSAIFVEQSWVPALMFQSEDRIHRIGQTGSVMIYRTMVRCTLDEVVYRVLGRKENVVGQVMKKLDDDILREYFHEPTLEEHMGRVFRKATDREKRKLPKRGA